MAVGFEDDRTPSAPGAHQMPAEHAVEQRGCRGQGQSDADMVQLRAEPRGLGRLVENVKRGDGDHRPFESRREEPDLGVAVGMVCICRLQAQPQAVSGKRHGGEVGDAFAQVAQDGGRPRIPPCHGLETEQQDARGDGHSHGLQLLGGVRRLW